MELIIIQARKCGNTTRIVDSLIQELFTKGECKIYDHHPSRNDRIRVFSIVLERLFKEHKLVSEDIQIDYQNFTLKLTKITYYEESGPRPKNLENIINGK